MELELEMEPEEWEWPGIMGSLVATPYSVLIVE